MKKKNEQKTWSNHVRILRKSFQQIYYGIRKIMTTQNHNTWYQSRENFHKFGFCAHKQLVKGPQIEVINERINGSAW